MSYIDTALVNACEFLDAYDHVSEGGEIHPRGGLCRELCDYSLNLDMAYDDGILTSFRARKLNLRYACEEFLWYLRADRYDCSIENHATLWKKIRQPDGGYNSNYGVYIFERGPRSQFNWVVDQLVRDKDSRQASIVLLQPSHLVAGNTDVVCTYGINFRIRNMTLDMTVMMRSNDIIFGMTNDVFCFSLLYRMVYAKLWWTYQDLIKGNYHHFVNSLHVYERHFEMIDQICDEGSRGWSSISVPWPTTWEVDSILSCHGEERSQKHGPMTRWLNEAPR